MTDFGSGEIQTSQPAEPLGGDESGGVVGQPSGATSSVDAKKGEQPATFGENSAGQGKGQEAGQAGQETGQSGAAKPEGPNAAQQQIAKQAEEGVEADPNGDGARKALEQIAGEILPSLAIEFSLPWIRKAAIELWESLSERIKDNELREDIRKQISIFLERTQSDEQGLLDLIRKMKDSDDLGISALGYDLEIAIKQEEVKRIENYLQQNQNASDAEDKRKELERLKKEIANLGIERDGKIEIPDNASEEERKKKEKGEQRRMKFPDNQVEAQLRPLVARIADAAVLSEEEKRILETQNPISAISEIFGRVVSKSLGPETTGQENGDKPSSRFEIIENFLNSLESSNLISKEGKERIMTHFNYLETLGNDIKKRLREITLDEVKRKGLYLLLGLGGVLAILAWFSAKSEMGSGRGGGMMH